MSLFNEDYPQLREERDLYLEAVYDNKVRRYNHFLGRFIFEDNYSLLFKNIVEIDEIQDSITPEKWSIPMQHFVDCLQQYIQTKNISLNTLQKNLIRIPTENVEERLTAGLEFFKAIIVNQEAVNYSNVALSFLNNTIELFLTSNPSIKALNFYTDKVNFINEMITNLNISNHPKVGELVKILNQIVYRFINRSSEDIMKYTVPIIAENTVASIAPVIGNATTKFNTTPEKLMFEPTWLVDKGYVTPDMTNNYVDFISEAIYEYVFTEDAESSWDKAKSTASKAGEVAVSTGKKALGVATTAAGMAGRTINAATRVGKEAIRKADEKFISFKNALLKKEKQTEEALKNSPYLDQKLSSLFNDAMVTGASYIALGGLGGLLSAIYVKYKYNKNITEERSRIKARLKEEIVIVDEKIKDYESSGDKEVKYALMRIKMKMQKAIEALDTKRSVEIANDTDLKHFRVDEKRLVRKGRIERAKQERYARSYDADNDHRYDD